MVEAKLNHKKEELLDKPGYVAPEMEKHEPVKIVQGSSSCSGLYYTSLYYW